MPKHLTNEERARVRTLYFDAKMPKSQIIQITGYSLHQIKKAIRDPIVRARSGRPTVLSPQQEEELVAFVTGSRRGRRMGFLELSLILFNAVFGMWAIKNTLYRLGF